MERQDAKGAMKSDGGLARFAKGEMTAREAGDLGRGGVLKVRAQWVPRMMMEGKADRAADQEKCLHFIRYGRGVVVYFEIRGWHRI